MNYTAEDIEKFHNTLRRACRMEQLPSTYSDKSAWETFLLQMQPLEGSVGGPFTLSDLTAVLSEMRRQKDQGAKWAMRPTTILRDPERFRDMVEEARRRLRMTKRVLERPSRPNAVQTLCEAKTLSQSKGSTISRLTDDPEPDPESITAGAAAAQTFADLRKAAGLTKP